MEFGIAILLTVAALFYTLFVRDKDLPEAPPVSPVEHLEQKKASVYENLRDLNFEYRVGKLSDADYAALTALIVHENGSDPGQAVSPGLAARLPKPLAVKDARRRGAIRRET